LKINLNNIIIVGGKIMIKEKRLNIMEMTKKEFENLPERKSFNEEVGEFDSIVILPTKYKHDSGYQCMDFVGCIEDRPIIRLSGCSDVMNIEGIGGFGYNWLEKHKTNKEVFRITSVKAWGIDCLPKSRLLRIFCRRKIKVGDALSSFEIWSIKEDKG